MRKISTPVFTFGSTILSILLISFSKPIGELLYEGNPPSGYVSVVIILILATMGSPGILGLVRKETATFDFKTTIQGKWAVVISLIWIVICYVPMIYFVFLAFF